MCNKTAHFASLRLTDWSLDKKKWPQYTHLFIAYLVITSFQLNAI